MLLRIPLALQKIHARDSILGIPGPFGDLRSPFGRGLKFQYVYAELIKKAFEDKYWKAPGLYAITDDGKLKWDPRNGYSQMEQNFSMFWGISVMLYEATLVSDQSEFDRLTAPGAGLVAAPVAGCFAPGPPGTPIPPGVDPLWLRGCNIFFKASFITGPFFDGSRPVTGAACTFCHSGPVFSENAVVAGTPFTPFLNPVTDINNILDIRDLGFANIGLRPVFSDPMVGGKDPYGNTLSFGRQYKQYKTGGNDRTKVLDPFLLNAIDTGTVQPNIVDGTVSKLETDGATKIPTLRNIGLTPPYFSWGFYSTLRQVLKVYNRGMNPRNISSPSDLDAHGSNCYSGDSSGSGRDGDHPWPVQASDCNTNTTGLILPLGLLDCDANGVANPDCATFGKDVTNDDLAALERFLKSLSDRRVQCDQAPFDHPSLFVFNGQLPTDVNHDGLADDIVFEFPEAGAGGYDPKSGYCIPNAGNLFAPGMQSRSGGQRVPLKE